MLNITNNRGKAPRRYAIRSINFSTDNVAVQWQYVKRNLQDMGILNQTDTLDIETKARQLINNFFQQSIYEEFNQQIKADWYERMPLRADVRSGTYQRILTTTFGRSQGRFSMILPLI